MPRHIRHRPWTLDEWTAYGRRCRALLDQVDTLIREFPETPGLKARDINLLIETHGRLSAAVWAVEGVYERQAAGRWDPFGGRSWCSLATDGRFWGRCTGRVRQAEDLSREEWSDLGRRVKAIRDETAALGMALVEVPAATNAITARFLKVCNRPLGRLQCRLDDLVCRQHPDWPEATSVFYGPAVTAA